MVKIPEIIRKNRGIFTSIIGMAFIIACSAPSYLTNATITPAETEPKKPNQTSFKIISSDSTLFNSPEAAINQSEHEAEIDFDHYRIVLALSTNCQSDAIEFWQNNQSISTNVSTNNSSNETRIMKTDFPTKNGPVTIKITKPKEFSFTTKSHLFNQSNPFRLEYQASLTCPK
jgi:hypothetical protein